jgi:hypothetical protein
VAPTGRLLSGVALVPVASLLAELAPFLLLCVVATEAENWSLILDSTAAPPVKTRPVLSTGLEPSLTLANLAAAAVVFPPPAGVALPAPFKLLLEPDTVVVPLLLVVVEGNAAVVDTGWPPLPL